MPYYDAGGGNMVYRPSVGRGNPHLTPGNEERFAQNRDMFANTTQEDVNNAATGISLTAALTNINVEEARPSSGGLGLLARQQRQIDVLKTRVSNIEQVI